MFDSKEIKKEIENIKKERDPKIRITGLVIIGIIISIVLSASLALWKADSEVIIFEKNKEPVTKEEIIESLTAPADTTPPYTEEEEREQIIESLTAPQAPEPSDSSFSEPPDESFMSQEEKKSILDSLTAPATNSK